jgi:hypothetical protein
VYGDTKGTNAGGQDGSVSGILETTSLDEAGTKPCDEIFVHKLENGRGTHIIIVTVTFCHTQRWLNRRLLTHYKTQTENIYVVK